MHLPVLNAQIPHGNAGTAVAVSLTDNLKAHSVGNSLLVAPRLAQGVATIVAPQVDGPCPLLHQLTDSLTLDVAVPLATGEDPVFVCWSNLFQISPECLGYGLVDNEDIILAGLTFADGESIANLQIADLIDF